MSRLTTNNTGNTASATTTNVLNIRSEMLF